MNLAIDIGNTSIKAATFLNDELLELHRLDELYELESLIERNTYDAISVCSVRQSRQQLLAQVSGLEQAFFLSIDSAIPIEVSYDTPDTLGMDRLAAAIGAHVLYPNKSVLIIDLGTCITYDLVHQATFQGGLISPGMNMRCRAMHEFTANLPLVKASASAELIGKSTVESMSKGVFFGVLGELEHHVSQLLLKIPDLKVIMTGGDAHLFESKIKSDIFVAPQIVLVGMNGVSRYNA